MKKLTDRQVAVLAAIERQGGEVVLPDFKWQEFPRINQSELLRVLRSLEKHGLVYSWGDDFLVYCRGVTFSTRPPTDAFASELSSLIQRVTRNAAQREP